LRSPQHQEEGLFGDYTDPYQNGFKIGVSDVPCDQKNDDDTAPCSEADICGHVQYARGNIDTTNKVGLNNFFWNSGTYSVDCQNKTGKYVFIQLPGDNRVIPELNVTISRAEFPRDMVANKKGDMVLRTREEQRESDKEKFVCYGILNRRANTLGTGAEYVRSDDVTDKKYYGTCFQRAKNIDFYAFAAADNVEQDVAEDKQISYTECLDCVSYLQNKYPESNKVYPVKIATDGCYDCSLMEEAYLATGTLDAVAEFATDATLNPTCDADVSMAVEEQLFLYVGVPVISVVVLAIIGGVVAFFLCRSRNSEPAMAPVRIDNEPMSKKSSPVELQSTPVKGEWEEMYDADGNMYYYNSKTDQSQWESPY
jgi:hypothetical protein